jgi:hypothetical protein
MSNYFLTQSAEFWELFCKSHVASISEIKCKELEKLEMKFKEEELTAVKIQAPVTIIVTDGSVGNLVLSCLKIHQSLRNDIHIMTDIGTFEKHKSEVLALWGRGTHCNILVVEDASDCADVNDIGTEIGRILNSCAKKTLVLIPGRTSPLTSKLKDQIKSTKYKDIFKFSQLDQKSQLRALRNKVKFQGYNMSLKSLLEKIMMKYRMQ